MVEGPAPSASPRGALVPSARECGSARRVWPVPRGGPSLWGSVMSLVRPALTRTACDPLTRGSLRPFAVLSRGSLMVSVSSQFSEGLTVDLARLRALAEPGDRALLRFAVPVRTLPPQVFHAGLGH